MIYFVCTENNLIPIKSENVRWLDKDNDYELARIYWQEWGQVLSYSTWNKAHEYGYQYAGIVEHGKIVSSAGIWRFSEKLWEIAAVSTLESHRKKGYSKSVIAFITSYTHKFGCVATCSTSDDNVAMIATAESVGFQQVPESEVWWNYPQLPDF
jgi:RimJ/RimL family protein N-acetyltransferase